MNLKETPAFRLVLQKFILLTLVLAISNADAQTKSDYPARLGPITKKDRILILAPHPDDETIGCAGIIQRSVIAKAPVKVVYLTNGDHNQIAFIVYEKRLTLKKGEFIHMGEVRRKESIRAMKLLGVNEKDLIFLGYPDFGTFSIFNQYWQDARPYRSLLTRISAVPYKENPSFKAPYKGESILNDLKSILFNYKPTKIFVSHPCDTNPDHKSLYLFLQIALQDLKQDIPEPQIYPYLIHCVGWPIPRHYHPQLTLEPPQKFLNSQISWFSLELNPDELTKKYQAILSYKSQTESSAFYLLAFARRNELFGDYPEIGLKKETALNEKDASFSSLSNMFADPALGGIVELNTADKDKGEVDYAVAADYLLIHIHKTKELDKKFGVMLYLFGYSHSTPFNKMPKIRIITRHDKFKVFDAGKMIQAEGMSTLLSDKDLILKIPLQVLGGPDFILASLKTHTGILSFDATGFRKIRIAK